MFAIVAGSSTRIGLYPRDCRCSKVVLSVNYGGLQTGGSKGVYAGIRSNGAVDSRAHDPPDSSVAVQTSGLAECVLPSETFTSFWILRLTVGLFVPTGSCASCGEFTVIFVHRR